MTKPISIDAPLFGNPLGAFDVGCQLDLRFKIALDLLKAGAVPLPRADEENEQDRMSSLVRQAIFLANELVSRGAERAWVTELPDTDDLPSHVRRWIRQQARANVFGQVAAQQVAAEEGPRLTPVQVSARQ